jgi:hypothetical protein
MDPILAVFLLIVLPIGLWYILFILPSRKNSRKAQPAAAPTDHLTERHQASAMLFASLPFAWRVKRTYELLEKIASLEKEIHDLRSAAPASAPIHPE